MSCIQPPVQMMIILMATSQQTASLLTAPSVQTNLTQTISRTLRTTWMNFSGKKNFRTKTALFIDQLNLLLKFLL